jgi:ribonuclease Z
MGMTPPTYILPPSIIPGVEALFEVWRALDGSDLPCRLVPLGPGASLPLDREWSIRPFRSPHRILCQGYALWRSRKRLRPELVGLPEPEIRRRRLAGEEVATDVALPEIAFTGDALIEVVEQVEAVRTARLLIVEVTFYDDRVSVEQCRSKGHIHLDEVIERAALFQNQAILFTHLSARYTGDEAQAILDRRLPPGLRERVTLLRPPVAQV